MFNIVSDLGRLVNLIKNARNPNAPVEKLQSALQHLREASLTLANIPSEAVFLDGAVYGDEQPDRKETFKQKSERERKVEATKKLLQPVQVMARAQ